MPSETFNFEVGDEVISYFQYLPHDHEDQNVRGTVTEIKNGRVKVKVHDSETGLQDHYRHSQWNTDHWSLVQNAVITEPSEDIYNDLI